MSADHEKVSLKPLEARSLLQKDEQTSTGLAKVFSNLVLKETNRIQASNELIDALKKCSQIEKSNSLKTVISEFSSSMELIKNSNFTYKMVIEQKILPSLNSLNTVSKEISNMIIDLEKKIEVQNKKQSAFDANKTKQSANKELNEAKKLRDITEGTLLNKMTSYCNDRNLEFKLLLQHFANAQMQYHTKALEQYSELYNKVSAINEDTEAKVLKESIFSMIDLS